MHACLRFRAVYFRGILWHESNLHVYLAILEAVGCGKGGDISGQGGMDVLLYLCAACCGLKHCNAFRVYLFLGLALC